MRHTLLRRALVPALLLAFGLPAAAQSRGGAPSSPLYDAVREAGGTASEAAGLSAAFTEEAKLVSSDVRGGDQFGFSVSLSGDRALVGADLDDDGRRDGGSAFMFVRASDGTWTQEDELKASDRAAGDRFGYAVSLEGDRALIGAIHAVAPGGQEGGAAYVFARNANGRWRQEAKLTASDPANFDLLGFSVSLSGNRALVGAPYDDGSRTDSGSAYVFVRASDGTWTQEAKFTAGTPSTSILARFGTSVSLSGDRALVGEFGSAYVFARAPGGAWAQEARLSAGPFQLAFGTAVSLEGDRALVGDRGDDIGETSSGAVYVFARTPGGTWAQEAKLKAGDPGEYDQFGSSVSLSGDRALIGAEGDDDEEGGDSLPAFGAAYVFARTPGGTWTQQDKITASDRGAAFVARFGSSVSLSGDRALAGAYANPVGGSAYVFALGPPPNAGFAFERPSPGDVYRTGGFLKPIWTSPTPAPATVTLTLVNTGGFSRVIYSGPNLLSSGAPGAFGAARYQIEPDVPSAADYRLRIEDADDPTESAVSAAFTILDRGDDYTFDFPPSGGRLALGATTTVRWASPANAPAGDVTIALLYKPTGVAVASVTKADDGAAVFALPTDQEGAYYFTITNMANPLYAGRSGSVRLYAVGVTDPAVGSVFTAGETTTIAFEAPTLAGAADVRVFLKQAGIAGSTRLASENGTDGAVDVTIPSGTTGGTDYYLVVYYTTGGTTYVGKSARFEVAGGVRAPIAAAPPHFALPAPFSTREATLTVAAPGLADGSEVGVFWGEALVGSAVVSGGVAAVAVRGEVLLPSLVVVGVPEEADFVAMPEGASLSLRAFAGAAETGLDVASPVAFADGAEQTVTVLGTDGAAHEASVLRVSAYPNPTTGAATVRFTTASEDAVSVAVYDVLGRRVATLLDGEVAAGPHTVSWDASSSAPGVYVVRVTAGGSQATARVTVAR